MNSRVLGSSVKRGVFALVLFAVSGGIPGVMQATASDGSDSEDVVRAKALPTPAIHYTFDTNLLDTHGNSTLTAASACPADPCNSASSFGSDSNGKYWSWSSTANRGGGFTLLTAANIGTSYTIALKFSFAQVTGWRKIIDYEDRVSDNGFYYYGTKLQFYNGGSTFNSATTYPANTVLDLVIVRESSNPSNPSVLTGTFTVYAVGSDNALTPLFQYSDNVGNSIPHVTSGGLTKLGFFFDDTATSSEATNNGKVYDLRIWSGASLSQQTLGEAVVRPAAVTNIVATPSTQTINVSWDPVTGATSYLAVAGGYSCTVNAPTTTCTITGLADGTSVTVDVQAIGPGGYSAIASTASPVVVGATTTTIAAPSAGATTTTIAATAGGGTTTTTPAGLETATVLPRSGRNADLMMVALVMLMSGAVLVGLRSRRVCTTTVGR